MLTIRDPIHNVIQFDKQSEGFLIDLINTREFQRLRQIKQLGLTTFAYPGAEHTRFSHSLGVTHLTKRFMDKIGSMRGVHEQRLAEEWHDHRKVALAAALLHDIGHGPFSHALENTTRIRHEKWTIAIIRGDTEIGDVLNRHGINPSEVAEVIQRTHRSKALVKLLSSQLDTDRIDYLLRDSKMSGAGYGTFDLEWLIHVLRIGEYNGELEVGIDQDKGLSIAEDFVMARYYMYTNVYLHKTTRSAELLIDKIFARAYELYRQNQQIEMPEDLLRILGDYDSLADVLSEYLDLTDSTIWHYISQWRYHTDGILHDLCTRMLNRNFFKATELPGMDDFSFLQQALDFSRRHDIDFKYNFFVDEAKGSSYNDSYLLQKPKAEEKEGEREASEQIVLFDHKGNGRELSNLSHVVNGIRNKPIAIRRYFVPEAFRKEITGG